MHNPGRYLVLRAHRKRVAFSAAAGRPARDPNRTTSIRGREVPDAFDYETGIQYMPVEQVTYDLEINHSEANVPYFAGHGGVTSPDGYATTPVPPGWRPDLVKSDTRIIAALLVRF